MLPLIGAFKLAKGLLNFSPSRSGCCTSCAATRATPSCAGRASCTSIPRAGTSPRAVDAILSLDTRRLEALSAGMFVYAGMFLVEGVGLMLGRRWAEYFTVVVTASFVPLEIYEIVRPPTAIRVAALLVNLAIGGIWSRGSAAPRRGRPSPWRAGRGARSCPRGSFAFVLSLTPSSATNSLMASGNSPSECG